VTYQEMFDSAMKCTTKEEADAWMDAEVSRRVSDEPSVPDSEARDVIKSNLGYMAGYYDDSVRDKVRDLFGALHPIFGDHRPTPQEAFRLGFELGEELGNKRVN